MRAQITALTCIVSGLLTTTGTAADNVPHERQLWSSTSDWFRPAPSEDARFGSGNHAAKANGRSWGFCIPKRLICSVPQRFREHAVSLLGDADIVPLSPQQCRSLGVPGDANPLLDEIIDSYLDLVLNQRGPKQLVQRNLES